MLRDPLMAATLTKVTDMGQSFPYETLFHMGITPKMGLVFIFAMSKLNLVSNRIEG